MFQIAICDDNMQDLEILQKITDRWLSSQRDMEGNIHIFSDPVKLIDDIEKGPIGSAGGYDLFILDVLMEPMNGIKLGERIRRRNSETSIVFTTISPDYAFNAYGTHALRYLLKPLEPAELYSALDLAYVLFSARSRQVIAINGPNAVTGIVVEDSVKESRGQPENGALKQAIQG